MQTPVPQQLALSLFRDMGDEPITEAKQEIGFRKSNALIDTPNLSLSARRCANAAFFLSVHNLQKDRYEYELDFFRWLARYPSRDMNRLREILHEVRGVSVQMLVLDPDNPNPDKRERWRDVNLFEHFDLDGGHIQFSLTGKAREQLSSPDAYTFLSLRISNSLNTKHAANLYERLLSMSFRGTTSWIDLDEFRGWLNLQDMKVFQEFRYLRRDVLEPSVSLINELTDIRVEYSTKSTSKNKSKKITHIQFSLAPNPGGKYAYDNIATQSDTLKALYNALRNEFGLNRTEFNEVIRHSELWDEKHIQNAIEYAREHIRDKRLTDKPIKHPNRFVLWALRDGCKLGDLLSQSEQPLSDREGAAERQQRSERLQNKKKAESAFKRFEKLTSQEQEAMLDEFARSQQFHLLAKPLLRGNRSLPTVVDVTENGPLRSVFTGFLLEHESIVVDN